MRELEQTRQRELDIQQWVSQNGTPLLQQRNEILEKLRNGESSFENILPPHPFSPWGGPHLIFRVFEQDREMVYELIEQGHISFSQLPLHWRGDREMTLHAISHNWSPLADASVELQNDIVEKAIYPSELKIWLIDGFKAPKIDDRK